MSVVKERLAVLLQQHERLVRGAISDAYRDLVPAPLAVLANAAGFGAAKVERLAGGAIVGAWAKLPDDDATLDALLGAIALEVLEVRSGGLSPELIELVGAPRLADIFAAPAVVDLEAVELDDQAVELEHSSPEADAFAGEPAEAETP